MKIAYVYDAVYPWETGGVQKRVWELAKRLARDHDVHWFGLHYWDGPATIDREGVTLHGVAPPPDLYVEGRRSIPEAIQFSARLIRPLLREEFDVIDCQQFPYFPGFSSKLHAVARESTLLLTWHEVWDSYWYQYLGWKGVFGQVVERLVATLPDTHVAVSEQTAREIQALSGESAHLVPNGVDLVEIEHASASDLQVDVLFVGRLIPEKNPMLVVDAMAKLRQVEPDIQCVLVGDGPERSSVLGRIRTLDLESNVSLLSPRDEYEEVLGLMKSATVFVLPSQREGFGMTILEALACGTPVVTIRHPQNAGQELIDDGTTGFVSGRSPQAIATAILEARSLSEAVCIDAAKGYDWPRIVEQIEGVYRDAVNPARIDRPTSLIHRKH